MTVFTKLALPEVVLVTPPRFGDARGYFCQTYVKPLYAANGIGADFVQDNESLSVTPGTVRGLHMQAPPFAQAKLVRVLAGAVFDVAVDVRKGSPTYGKWARPPPHRRGRRAALRAARLRPRLLHPRSRHPRRL